MMKGLLAILLRVLISVGLLALLFRQQWLTGGVTPHLQALREHWEWVLAGAACCGAGVVLWALRWWFVLRTYVANLALALVLRVTLIGWFFNISSIGALGGDAYRILAIGRLRPGTHVEAGVSVVIDHAAGMLGMLLLFAITGAAALAYWPHYEENLRPIIAMSGAVLLGAVLLMTLGLGSFSPAFLRRFGHLMPRRLGPLREKMVELQVTLRGSWRSVIAAAGISLPMMFFHFAGFYCALRAVGGEARLLPVLLAMPVVDTAASLPVSISGLGVREKVFETLMTMLTEVPAATCVAASLTGWLFTVVWGVIGGVLFALGRRAKAEIVAPPTPAVR